MGTGWHPWGPSFLGTSWRSLTFPRLSHCGLMQRLRKVVSSRKPQVRA